MDFAAIEAVIFDLGGVIINIDYLRTILGFNGLRQDLDMVPYSQDEQAELFNHFEMGHISAAEFRDGIRELLGIDCEDGAIDDAWNAMLLDIPPERITLLEKLGQQKRLFLLSNINEIHMVAVERIFQGVCGDRHRELADLFECTYYSHLVGDRKPHPSIFQRVIDEQHLDPARTIFIEDTIRHIRGAQQAGLRTHHLTKGETILDLLWLTSAVG